MFWISLCGLSVRVCAREVWPAAMETSRRRRSSADLAPIQAPIRAPIRHGVAKRGARRTDFLEERKARGAAADGKRAPIETGRDRVTGLTDLLQRTYRELEGNCGNRKILCGKG